jgi:uncharacterized membrane protein YkvA (DUF1232 family)
MKVWNNRFFQFAIQRAIRIAGKPGRILNLLTQLTLKLSRTSIKSVNATEIKNQFLLIGRLLKASVLGKYKIQSMRIFIIMLAAVIYFVNPLDLIPDFIFGIGYTDDLAVLAWVYNAASKELENFKSWEHNQTIIVRNQQVDS